MPPKKVVAKLKRDHPQQSTFYVAAEYIDRGDRLLVEDGHEIALYSVDLKLAQHWYAAAWRGRRLDLGPLQHFERSVVHQPRSPS
jgi:hypothetical protein